MDNFSNDLLDIFFSIGMESAEAETLAQDVSKEVKEAHKNNGQEKPNYATLMKLYDRKSVIIDGEEFFLPIIEKE